MHAGIHPPWRPAARHGIPPAMHAGIDTPLETCCKACWDTSCNACWDTQPPPLVNRMTNRSDITLATTSLRLVKMHSSRMHTTHSLTFPGTGCLLRGVPVGGVSCDLSHHTFDVTCMLPPHQLSVSTSAAAYIV